MNGAMARALGSGPMGAGAAATLHAMNGPDDSPFFLAVWCVIATSIVVALGWLAGGRLLRW